MLQSVAKTSTFDNFSDKNANFSAKIFREYKIIYTFAT
jgi:hypothetical protein